MKRYRIRSKEARLLPKRNRRLHLPHREATRGWTPEQERAITLKGGGILVSAAAGSGKTAVLVERIIRRITDPVSPIPADRFLVVTFTNAAAAEMRSRISRRLREKIAEDPENPFYERQLLLLSKARICTMDAFFSAMVRENFERLGVSPNLRIADEPELAFLRASAIEAVLERRFADPDPDFLAAVSYFGDDSGEALSRETVGLYLKTRNLPDPESWLSAQEAAYASDEPGWRTLLLSWVKLILEEAKHSLLLGICLLDWSGPLRDAYLPAFQSDLEQMELASQLADAGNWDGLFHFLRSLSFGRLKNAPRSVDADFRERVKAFRDAAKDTALKAQGFLPSTLAGLQEDLTFLLPIVRGLCRLVREFGDEFSARKTERNAADFSDYAAWTLRLVSAPDGTPTDFAKELSAQFEEILLDEYQDTNQLQDRIFRSISRNGENLFFVGDLKQSIYRFRSADPGVFLRCRAASREDGSFPALLRLSKNFRSRKGVLDGVNCVFSQIMSPIAGGISYDEGETVRPGARFPERPGACIKVQLLDMKEIDAEDTRLIAEAKQTARLVASMLKEGYPVTENGVLRPCRGGDFAILLRSAKGADAVYCAALQEAGVEATVGASEGYFTSREVSVMLSLLEVLDNPLRDIPMAALLLSPLGNYSCDGLTALRLKYPSVRLYHALSAEAKEGDAAASEFLSLLTALREKAAVKRIRGLIQYIYDTTDFVEVVSGLSASEEREANLKLLLNYAGDYENQGNGELSGFVSFIRRTMEEKKDFEVANPLSEQTVSVQILTAHRSKGLEYPIVILGNCSKRFNQQDVQRDTCFSAAGAGYGMKVVRRDTLQRYDTIPSAAVRLVERNEVISEEERLLYVAMTRARETLILNITEKNLTKTLQRLASQLDEDRPLSAYSVLQMQSWAEWLLAAFLRHPDFRDVRNARGIDVSVRNETFPLELSWIDAPEALAAEAPLPPAPDPDRIARLEEQIHWTYPHLARTRIPAKLAVTELVRQEESQWASALPLPAFAKKAGFTPAQKGSIFHRALQFADYAAGREDPEAELFRLTEAGYLTEEEAKTISPEEFAAFFRSPLMDRILKADRILREYRFFSTVPASQASYEGGGEILIQGIADCILEEDGAGVILDFKTDRTSPEDLLRRHTLQLNLYRDALKELFPKGIKECLLYSVHLKKAIPVPEK